MTEIFFQRKPVISYQFSDFRVSVPVISRHGSSFRGFPIGSIKFAGVFSVSSPSKFAANPLTFHRPVSTCTDSIVMPVFDAVIYGVIFVTPSATVNINGQCVRLRDQ